MVMNMIKYDMMSLSTIRRILEDKFIEQCHIKENSISNYKCECPNPYNMTREEIYEYLQKLN